MVNVETGLKTDVSTKRKLILDGGAILGIELGSTRIKAVLIDDTDMPLASGSYDWENRYENEIWTYHLDDVWTGIRESYAKLCAEVKEKYDAEITSLGAIGFSAMMHGYLPFDKQGNQLVPFRTWRNTTTEQAASALTKLFSFNIPQRWSIAHLYQAILNGEEHVKDIDFLTTLAGYVHWRLTGKRLAGVGEASGMFPIDSTTNSFDAEMLKSFNGLIEDKHYPWRLADILPEVLPAGENAGFLTEEGAALLDVSGKLRSGIPFCPPEGDAGTGMAATNSVAECTGNISAGTSVFAMIVLKEKLKHAYPEIDVVTTPSGNPVAMVHCNSCTSDINAWAQLFCEFSEARGTKCTMPEALDAIFYSALDGEKNCGGLLSYNYFSGEPITGLDEGRPLFVRMPDAGFTFANFSRNLLCSSMATLKIGMDILSEKENIKINSMVGHGGFFKAEGVGQKILSAALNVPVTVMKNAGEGGPWGMALLASYMVNKKGGESLDGYLSRAVFSDSEGSTIMAEAPDIKGFSEYMDRYAAGLDAERTAAEKIK